jgi:hypothetical protein
LQRRRGDAAFRARCCFDGDDYFARSQTMFPLDEWASYDPQAWPADVLARLADQPTKSIHELPPWNWRPQNVAHAA